MKKPLMLLLALLLIFLGTTAQWFTWSLWGIDGAGQIGIHGPPTPHTMRVFNIFTNVSNFESAQIQWSGNIARFVATAAGTGTVRPLTIGTDGIATLALHTNLVTRWTVDGSVGYFTSAGVAFASLGTPAAGAFIYCTDCTKATPCAGAGAGAFAKRQGAGPVWDCN